MTYLWERVEGTMFESMFIFLIPYIGWGFVILLLMLFLDVVIAVYRNGVMDLYRRLDDELQHDQEEAEAKKRTLLDKVIAYGFGCLIICAWPIVIVWWLRNTALCEMTLLEKLLDWIKKEDKEENG